MPQAIKGGIAWLNNGGPPVQTQPEVKHIEDTLTVNVHGKSLTDTGKTKMYQVFIMDLDHN